MVRKDLPTGVQLAQTTHAAIDFCMEHPSIAKQWHKDSNYLVCLNAQNEYHIQNLMRRCEELKIPYTIFIEPDIDNELTAIAIAPTEKTNKITGALPLAMKGTA